MTPYYQDDAVTIYHGDMFDLLPECHEADATIADPPYGETSLQWDRWPEGMARRRRGETAGDPRSTYFAIVREDKP